MYNLLHVVDLSCHLTPCLIPHFAINTKMLKNTPFVFQKVTYVNK